MFHMPRQLTALFILLVIYSAAPSAAPLVPGSDSLLNVSASNPLVLQVAKTKDGKTRAGKKFRTSASKKKASGVSCGDLHAAAERRCGRHITCDADTSCLQALCSRRWMQCGFKPECVCTD